MLLPFFDKSQVEAGCDEAGRGCLAGSVFAAAVILPTNFYHPDLNDSKQLNAQQRNILRHYIEETAISYAVASVSASEIDQINILNASFLAMHRALEQLRVVPTLLLIDGNRFKPFREIPFQCVVKGDAKFASIAAASILAKTYRDEYMHNLDTHFPQYAWRENKGYPTQKHRAAIKQFGVCSHHRLSFQLLEKSEQQELFSEK